jgi:hypothetical protein
MKHEWMRDERWMDDKVVKIEGDMICQFCLNYHVDVGCDVLVCWVNTDIDHMFPQ